MFIRLEARLKAQLEAQLFVEQFRKEKFQKEKKTSEMYVKHPRNASVVVVGQDSPSLGHLWEEGDDG